MLKTWWCLRKPRCHVYYGVATVNIGARPHHSAGNPRDGKDILTPIPNPKSRFCDEQIMSDFHEHDYWRSICLRTRSSFTSHMHNETESKLTEIIQSTMPGAQDNVHTGLGLPNSDGFIVAFSMGAYLRATTRKMYRAKKPISIRVRVHRSWTCPGKRCQCLSTYSSYNGTCAQDFRNSSKTFLGYSQVPSFHKIAAWWSQRGNLLTKSNEKTMQDSLMAYREFKRMLHN